ncbi:hypothetical protein HK099_002105 [Clydaea vesicula]|uniref:Sulfate transporter n=1 Tax=Clydaea vesicula TaxID=447962 RepID=A0AAD5U2Y1_9FUNG|nr:hypothetical protein HK099_002105 [Clydaea vesicula]
MTDKPENQTYSNHNLNIVLSRKSSSRSSSSSNASSSSARFPTEIRNIDSYSSNLTALCSTSEYNTDLTEATPLIKKDENKNQKPTKQSKAKLIKTSCSLALYSVPAVILGLILTILDAATYGIIVFPVADYIPDSATQAGISMFLSSTFVSQLIYTFGSEFKGVNGSMMIEVMPFLHLMCSTIVNMIPEASDEAKMSNIMLVYAVSTLLTGIIFLIIGFFKLGNIISFFPRHILIGCIGGIGVFLFVTGIKVTSRVTAGLGNYDDLLKLFEPKILMLWSSSLILAISLKCIQKKIKHPLFVPCFYSSVNIETLRLSGWLFSLPKNNGEVPFYTYWTYFDFSLIDVEAFFACVPTILALTFFGILHVPINVPALSVSTNQQVNINTEIVMHGFSNLFSGLIGSCQNYLVYTNSVLFFRSGGDSRIAGFLLTVAVGICFFYASSVILFVPVIVVGSLIFHLAIDLMIESLYDTWSSEVSNLEYLTILVIVITMTGFTEGIVAGILMACVLFVYNYSQRSVITEVTDGGEMRSTIHRPYKQQKYLDLVGSQVKILSLRGFLFFGTINQVDSYVRNHYSTEGFPYKYLVVDFSLIETVDLSAIEILKNLNIWLNDLGVKLLIVSGGGSGKEKLIHALDSNDNIEAGDAFNHFTTLEEALRFTEAELLEIYFQNLKKIEEQKKSVPASPSRDITHSKTSNDLKKKDFFNDDTTHFSPRTKIITNSAKEVLENYDDECEELAGDKEVEFKFLFDTFYLILKENQNLTRDEIYPIINSWYQYFEKVKFSKGVELWKKGYCLTIFISNFLTIDVSSDTSEVLYIVESGQLSKVNNNRIIESLFTGTMVGELCFFTEQPRTCSLVVSEDSVLWKMRKADYEKMILESPKHAVNFTRMALTFDAERMYTIVNRNY